jgi:hypothetical protein
LRTREVPGLAFVEVHFANGAHFEADVADLAGQVVADELLVRGVEAEARRELHAAILLHPHASLAHACHAIVSTGGDPETRSID